MDFIDASSPWFWIALALAIGVIELLTGTVLFLALAVAVASVAALAAFAPDLAADWRFASPLVAAVWLIATVLLKRYAGAFRSSDEARRDVNDV